MSLPRLFARDPDEHHRAATQLELLFDLISVIAIAAATHGLAHSISAGHGLEALPRFTFLFVAIWWAWINFTWFASAFDNDSFFYRLMVMLIMLGELIFAGGAKHIFETLDFSFGVFGWVLMRLGMAALWLGAARGPEHRATALRYAGGILFAQLLWTTLYFVFTPGSPAFFATGIAIFLVEFAVPMFAERAGITPFHRHHIIERYGLLTIIALGEIMLSVSHGFSYLFESPVAVLPAFTAVAAFAITAAIFWIYFTSEDHLPQRTYYHAFTWGYGHVFIFAAIAALGAGITAEIDLSAQPAPEAVVSHAAPEAAAPTARDTAAPEAAAAPAAAAGHEAPAHGPSRAGLAGYVGGPMALFFVALWAVRDRHYPLGKRAAALPVGAVLALVGVALGLPTSGFALIAIITLLWRVPLPQGTGCPGAAPPPVSH